MTSEKSMLFYVSCHQSYKSSQTLIDPDLFLDSSLLCIPYYLYLITLGTVHHCLYV